MKKCIVKDCTNTSDRGEFAPLAEICMPCFIFITCGNFPYSQVYRNAVKVYNETLEQRTKAER